MRIFSRLMRTRERAMRTEVPRAATRGQRPEEGLERETATKKKPKPAPAIAPWASADFTDLPSLESPPEERRRTAGRQRAAREGEGRGALADEKAEGEGDDGAHEGRGGRDHGHDARGDAAIEGEEAEGSTEAPEHAPEDIGQGREARGREGEGREGEEDARRLGDDDDRKGRVLVGGEAAREIGDPVEKGREAREYEGHTNL
jgi:hypothetical protein